MTVERKRGPVEQEMYEMTRAGFNPAGMDSGQLLASLLGHLSKLEEALQRLGRELDERASGQTITLTAKGKRDGEK